MELKILDYFFCKPAHDLGWLGPVSLSCHNTWVPVKQVLLDPWRALTIEQGLAWCEMWSWRLWITFPVFLHMIWGYSGVSGSTFPIFLCPNTYKTSVTQSSDDLGHIRCECGDEDWIFFHLCGHISYGYLQAVSPNFPMPEYLLNKYISIFTWSWHMTKVSFDVKFVAKDMGLLSVCPCT